MSLEKSIFSFLCLYLVDEIVRISDVANEPFYSVLDYSAKKRMVISITRNIENEIITRLNQKFSLFAIDKGFSINKESQDAFEVILSACFRSDVFMEHFAVDVLSYEKTESNGIKFTMHDIDNPFYDVSRLSDKSIKFAVEAFNRTQHTTVKDAPESKVNRKIKDSAPKHLNIELKRIYDAAVDNSPKGIIEHITMLSKDKSSGWRIDEITGNAFFSCACNASPKGKYSQKLTLSDKNMSKVLLPFRK
jgi:hypothetical protein